MTLMKESNEILYKVIGSCMEVHRTLGPGYPVEYYRKALEVEFETKELSFETKKPVQVIYKEMLIGVHEVDFWVNNSVLIVLRVQEDLKDLEIQQMLRLLTLMKSSIGLLVNFGNVKIQYKRILPSRQGREIRKEAYRPLGYREMGRTREGNPLR
jgi:GxxExxY protein